MQSPYPLWDISMARDAGRLRPYVRVLNLTDTSYQEIPGVPVLGRTVMAGMQLNLRRSH
jgi:iron complex outermembrane receptor protein